MRSSYILPLSAEDATDVARVGPKAANLAALARAGLPTPGGFCISAAAYWRQVEHLGLAGMVSEYDRADPPAQRRLAVEIRLKLYQSDLAPDVLAEVLASWWAERKPAAVRSSALIEDRADANFAGQFESFLGIADDAEFLTALRASWAALWTTNARRSMAAHAQSPGDTAMAVLVQPLVAARVSGGGLSETADGHMLLSATWGLGSTIAQGEVVPDRIVLSRHGFRAVERSGPQTSPRSRTRACSRPSSSVRGSLPNRWSSRPRPRRCCRLSAARPANFSRCLRRCWRTPFASATPNGEPFIAGRATLCNSWRRIICHQRSPKHEAVHRIIAPIRNHFSVGSSRPKSWFIPPMLRQSRCTPKNSTQCTLRPSNLEAHGPFSASRCSRRTS